MAFLYTSLCRWIVDILENLDVDSALDSIERNVAASIGTQLYTSCTCAEALCKGLYSMVNINKRWLFIVANVRTAG